MTNKSTKKALLLSILSMLICVAMLVGTTFAWFTDSVTSGKNTITAGNLDVELEYLTEDGWKTVEGATDLLDPNALWEPGHAEVVYLKISNLGTLALKYQFSMNIFNETVSKSVLGNELKLSEYLKYGVVDFTEKFADREAAIAAVESDAVKLGKYVDEDTMLKGAAPKTIALVVYMPTTVGNEANYAKGEAIPTIELGVNLVATQFVNENDFFNNEYDEDADLPVFGSATKEEGKASTVKADNVTTDIPANAPAGDYTLTVSNKHLIEGINTTTISLDIELTKDGSKVSPAAGVLYTVQIDIGKNLEVTALTHNGNAVANYSYDPATGIVSFTTDSFSPFAVTYKEADADSVFVPSDPEIAEKLEKAEVVAVDENGNEYTNITDAVKSGASKLYFKEGADLGTVTHLDVANDLVIYGNGAKLTGGNRDLAVNVQKKFDKDVTITVYNLHGVGYWGNTSNGYTLNLNLYNCNDVCEVFINGTSGVTNIGLYNCTYNLETLVGDTAVYSNANGSVTIDGCTFNSIPCVVNLNHKLAGEQTVTVTNSTFVDCATEGTAAYYAPIRLYNSAEGANQTLTVKDNTFTYSEGKAPINNADVLLNAKHNGADATGTVKANVQINATVACGVNVDLNYTIANADELAYFAAEVNKGEEYYGNTYEGKTVVLTADIDLGGAEWTPIGYFGNTSKQFEGTFDGQGHTVSNFKITQKSPDREGKNRSSNGFFGNVNGTVKNLTIADADVKVTNDGRFVGGIIGRLNGGLVENCKLIDSYVEGSVWQIGGIVGQVNAGTIQNCVVDNTTVVGKAGGVAAIAGFQMEAKETTINNCVVKNCAIKQSAAYGAGYDDMFAAVIGCVNNSGATVNINGCTVENTTVKGVASSALYGYIEDGAKVTVDGYEIIADGLGKNGVKYAVYNANGLATLNSMMIDGSAGKEAVVNLMADIDFAGKTWTTVDAHYEFKFSLREFNGNGHTLYNLTVNGQAMFKRFSNYGDDAVVIKDITFDNADINSNGNINTSILVVQTYENLLLDNVDVKNSSINGGYKVAPLIATVYNESSSTITATLKNCDVSDTVVTATVYDFCTTGMVAFVYASDNDKIEFENCTVTNVEIYAPDDSYDAHAWIYTTGSGSLFNEATGVTVSGCTFENK